MVDDYFGIIWKPVRKIGDYHKRNGNPDQPLGCHGDTIGGRDHIFCLKSFLGFRGIQKDFEKKTANPQKPLMCSHIRIQKKGMLNGFPIFYLREPALRFDVFF